MTTMTRAMPLASRLGAMGSELLPNVRRMAARALARRRSSRRLHALSDRMLADIGLQRQDVMSPEARRAMDRLNMRNLW